MSLVFCRISSRFLTLLLLILHKVVILLLFYSCCTNVLSSIASCNMTSLSFPKVGETKEGKGDNGKMCPSARSNQQIMIL